MAIRLFGVLISLGPFLVAACGSSSPVDPRDQQDPQKILQSVSVTPGSATLDTGETRDFDATGQWSDGSSGSVEVIFSASGGTVDTTGLYAAGSSSGSYQLVARHASSGLADTADITVQITQSNPNSPADYDINRSGVTIVTGEDWDDLASQSDLQDFGGFYDATSQQASNGDYYAELVSDPEGIFGNVVRVRQDSDRGNVKFYRDWDDTYGLMDEVWYRWTVRWEPGWTTDWGDPNSAAAWKMAFLLWEAGCNERMQAVFTNTDDYNFSIGLGGCGSLGTHTDLGSVNWVGQVQNEWTNGEWYEYVMHYERISSTHIRARWWKRQLTSNGQIVDNDWQRKGVEFTSGTSLPQMRGIYLGSTFNEASSVSSPQYRWWGPWEIIDGTVHPNPYNLPDVSGEGF